MAVFERDILIVGAGASGLACAKRLLDSGQSSVSVLESRARVGGRVLTRRVGGLTLELGAEFVHGTPPFTFDLLERNHLPFYDVTGEGLFIDQGQAAQRDFNALLEKVVPRLDPDRDLPLDQFIRLQSDLDDESKRFFLNFVEGFHAADPHVMGERAFSLAGAANEGELNGIEMFRLPLGYGQVFRKLARGLDVHFNQAVRRVHWRDGQVELHCESGDLWRSKKVVITVPLGVLQAGRVHFEPMPKGFQEALLEMRMGHIQRINFVFKTRFWEEHQAQPVGFIHGQSVPFPTWWSQSPMRTPVLVAWQGGPKAQALAQISLRERCDLALKSLGRHFGRDLRSSTLSAFAHNWSTDPHTLGAYSYLIRGHKDQWRRLKKSFGHTLYFAGEALSEGAERGTVHGALHSGLEAAATILRE